MRTLIRLPADPARADVLRGERSRFAGEVIEQAAPSVVPDAPVGTPVVAGPPDIRLLIAVGPGEEDAAREAYEDLIDWQAKQ